MAGVSTEAKVGIFVLLGIAILAYMTIRLGDFTFGGPEGYEVYAVFDQASGLKKMAPVEMAGIPIGQVSRISLDRGRARVTMLISKQVPLGQDVTALIRTRGVLGDKFIALEPGSPGAPKLKDGQQIVRAEVPTDLDRVMSRVGEVADNIKDITDSLKVSIASPESAQNISEALANLRELTGSLKTVVADNQQRLNRIVVNMDRFTGDLSQISDQNKAALNETIKNFQLASRQMQTTIASLTSVMQKVDKGEGTIGQLVNNKQTIDDLNSTLASLKDVSNKIAKGEGTIGKLINDDTTVTKIDDALTSINDYLARADAWRVFVEYRGDYNFKEESLRSELNVRLQPKADKFFLIGVVDDPRGKRAETKSYKTVDVNGVVTTTQTNTVNYNLDDLTFNAQFGKRFWDLVLRAGIFSSTGGVGADYYLWDERVRLTAEAYDWSMNIAPRVRFSASYDFWSYFYMSAGVDDIFSKEGDTSFFLGGGIYFSDDDLRFLLTKAPASP
ncbi:MAG: MCE family protein [Desulfarculaceae bacterium]|nr:MCE family protein [Desulfarculaceae bacterium]MCF8072784.1 MCE family protein [Desulfarculaceae bacterium]MCF8100952.1 MCE family protein [Desulfarculaceae bacterium]MCF8117564.1 MCE family protein [Desulfarculaceae bacterium]